MAVSSISKLTHLAWCALIALQIEKKRNIIFSAEHEHFFLLRWLESAKKKKVFSRDLARDINWLITDANQRGTTSRIRDKVEYIWQTGSGKILRMDYSQRLKAFMDAQVLMGWVKNVLSHEKQEIFRPEPGLATVAIFESAYAKFLSDASEYRSPFTFYVYGPSSGLIALADDCGLNHKLSTVDNKTSELTIYP